MDTDEKDDLQSPFPPYTTDSPSRRLGQPFLKKTQYDGTSRCLADNKNSSDRNNSHSRTQTQGTKRERKRERGK